MPYPSSARLSRLADWLIRHRVVLLCLAVVLLAVGWPISNRLAFDQTFESLYARNDPQLLAFQASKRMFGADEFVMVAYSDPQLFEPGTSDLTESATKRIRELTHDLNEIPGVDAESTQNLVSALRFPFGRKRALELVNGVLLGDDRQTTAIVLRLIPSHETEAPRGDTIARIRTAAQEFARRHRLPDVVAGESAFVVGEPVQLHDMFRYVEEDGRTLFWWSLLLLGLVILMLFRALRWVTLPLAVVVTTIVWTEAVLVLSAMRLSMVSSILNSLVTIIGIATVMHVTVRFRDKRVHLERVPALRETLAELMLPIFWTCATTAGGFAALLSSQITPIRSFGTMMATATLMVLAAAAMILPGGILIGRHGADPRPTPAEDRLVRFLGRITGWVSRHSIAVLAVTIAIFAGSVAGFSRLEIETDFSKNFRSNSPIVQALGFVETRLGGSGTWEVNFPAPKELSADYLERVRNLTARLRALCDDESSGLTKVSSVSDGVDIVPELPIFLNTLERRLTVLQSVQPEFLPSLYNPDAGRMRIVLRAIERQPSGAKLKLIARVQQLVRDEFPPSEHPDQPPAVATGMFVMLAYLIESLLGDQWVSFAWAGLGIVTMMTIAFRSLTIGLISLVPNVFPITLVIGGMGWVGLPINIGTAMIASVSMGLTVDSSIHYLSDYRRSRSRGLSVTAALRETHQGVGRALVFANIALIVGFSVLTLSHFIPLVYFGILVSMAMLGGLVGNLILLPLLLRWIDREPQRSPSSSDVEEHQRVVGG